MHQTMSDAVHQFIEGLKIESSNSDQTMSELVHHCIEPSSLVQTMSDLFDRLIEHCCNHEIDICTSIEESGTKSSRPKET